MSNDATKVTIRPAILGLVFTVVVGAVTASGVLVAAGVRLGTDERQINATAAAQAETDRRVAVVETGIAALQEFERNEVEIQRQQQVLMSTLSGQVNAALAARQQR